MNKELLAKAYKELMTVRYFKGLGLEFVKGDERESLTLNHGNVIMEGRLIVSGDNTCQTVLDAPMAAFAWRTNTGEKPSFKGEIEVQHRDGRTHTDSKYQKSWRKVCHSGDIIKWRPLLNYKEEDMNKVVRDAVIKYKGEWPDCYVNQSQSHCKECYAIASDDSGTLRVDDCISGSSYIVSTYKQFNTYIDSLSHHAGKELFQQYLAADKTLLTKETKVDYTSEEFWKDAPEGATHYKLSLDESGTSCWYMANENKLALMFNGCWGYTGWKSTEVINNIVGNWKVSFIPRPQPKPVFTQEMSDNEIPPEVGAKFIVGNVENDSRIIDFRGLEVEVVGLSKTVRGKHIITFEQPAIGVGCCVFNNRWVTPIDNRTEKEKACDAIWKELDDSGVEYDLRTAMELAYDKWVANP